MEHSGKMTWRSPSNIALVKYWGKKGIQLPVNPSISMSLETCYTETSISYTQKRGKDGSSFDFTFEGKENPVFAEKLVGFIDTASGLLPGIQDLHLAIDSRNSFPHSAGIASSASALSALALCLCDINRQRSGLHLSEPEFFRQASNLSRLGSGSASRSVYGGWVLWGETSEMEESSDNHAIPINELVNERFKNYYDAILIVSSGEKQVKSSQGHQLMKSNPLGGIRAETGKENTIKLLHALKSGNQLDVRNITESEAAGLHSMFHTSNPPFSLIKPGTDAIIEALLNFRRATGTEFCYTLDAGPNVHLLYPNTSRKQMLSFIGSDLAPLCESGKWIDDRIGKGPEKIN